MTDQIEYKITVLLGEKKLEPVKYYIVPALKTKWFGLRTVTEYYIESEFVRIGPYDSYADAATILAYAMIKPEIEL